MTLEQVELRGEQIGRKNVVKTPVSGGFSQAAEPRRGKSSQRMKYEAEVAVLKRKIGSLDDIRSQLGLTQRKICQLLLVDPSAWTRWTRRGEEPPPHIYRSLQWFLALEEKYPALDVGFWLSSLARPAEQENQAREIKAAQEEIHRLSMQLAQARSDWEGRFQNDEVQRRALEQQRKSRTRTLFGVSMATALIVGLVLGRFLFG